MVHAAILEILPIRTQCRIDMILADRADMDETPQPFNRVACLAVADFIRS